MKKEKRTNLCRTCGKLFEINVKDEAGKPICLFNRRHCLICKPKKNKLLPPEYFKFIEENYSNHGVKWCCENSELTKNQVVSIAGKLNLKIDPRVHTRIRSEGKLRPANQYKIFHEDFLNIDTSTKAYLLGLLWTDGHIAKNNHTITLSTTPPDDQYFIPLFQETGKWSVHVSKSRNHWKNHVSIYTTNRFIHVFLKEYNYNNKHLGFQKIYDYIPLEYKKYFIIGLIDGDGCFYANETNSSYRFSLCSTYEQDWSCFENILRELKINWKIERTIGKSGSYSKVHISGRLRIAAFGDYVYENYSIGLPRKRDKYLLAKNSNGKREYVQTLNFIPQ